MDRFGLRFNIGIRNESNSEMTIFIELSELKRTMTTIDSLMHRVIESHRVKWSRHLALGLILRLQ